MDDGWFSSDDDSWHGEEGYNLEVAGALREASRQLAQGSTAARLLAFNSIAGVLDAEMSSHQRLAILYVAALALASDDPPTRALEVIDEALELALRLGVERAQGALLFLRASVDQFILQVPDAVEDLRLCLDVITAQSELRELSPAELNTRLQAYLRLAQSEFLIGHYDDTERLLNWAKTLIPRAPDNVKASSLLAWTQALLLRWRGEYELALTAAMEAADGYARHSQPGMVSRIQGIVGEIALDLAERCKHTDQPLACAAFLSLAEPYIQRAIEIAAANDYGSSETMAFITHARLGLLRGDKQDRTGFLQEHAQRAAKHQDVAVMAQAYTQLGREYEAQSDILAARKWYRRAVEILQESQMTALGVWSQRALWRLGGEMQVDAEISAGGHHEV